MNNMINDIKEYNKKLIKTTPYSLKLYPLNLKSSVMYLFLSSKLIGTIKETGRTHINFGIIKGTNQLVLQLTKDESGLNLLNKYGEYRNSSIGAKVLFECVQREIPSIVKSKLYKVVRVDDYTFTANIEQSDEITESINFWDVADNIEWFKEIVPPKNDRFSFKFYNEKMVSPTIYLSSQLRNVASEHNKGYMQVGINRTKGTMLIRFTNDENNIGLVKSNKQTRLFGATSLYYKLEQELSGLESEKTYLGSEVDDVTYEFLIDSKKASNNTLNSNSIDEIEWLELNDND